MLWKEYSLERPIIEKYSVQLKKKSNSRELVFANFVYRYYCYQALLKSGLLEPKAITEKENFIRSYLKDFINFDETDVPIAVIMQNIRYKATPVLNILDSLKEELREFVMCELHYLWHVSSKDGLTNICASQNKLNMYYSFFGDAVFATSDIVQMLLYCGRAIAGGMEVNDKLHICTYEKNPFIFNKGKSLLLKKPVFAYKVEPDSFEPVIDLTINQNGTPELHYGYEWLSNQKQIKIISCNEVTEIDIDMIGGYQIYFKS